MTGEIDWTIRFPYVNGDEPFEVEPISMTFRRKRREMDFVRAKLSWQVGQEMKPHTRLDGGPLREQQPAELVANDTTVQVLKFSPDYVEYDSEFTYLELHDAQKALESGVIDKQWNTVTLKDAYRYAFEQRNDNGILNGLKFAIPADLTNETLFGIVSGTDQTDKPVDSFEKWKQNNDLLQAIKLLEADKNSKLVGSHYAVNFDRVSPLEAIWQLNNEYGLISWTDPDGTLWVGTPETTADYHIAARHDDRVWQLAENPSISHPREPVQSIIVEGKWVDEVGLGEADDLISWFNPSDKDGFGDYRMYGAAKRTDIDSGLRFTVKNKKAKRDALEIFARSRLREEMKRQNSGQVQIAPETSGRFTEIEHVQVGDVIRLVPNDKWVQYADGEVDLQSFGEFGKTSDEVLKAADGEFIHNELYVVTGVEHQIEDHGEWSTSLDVALYPANPIKSDLLYYDPQSNQFTTASDLYDGDWRDPE